MGHTTIMLDLRGIGIVLLTLVFGLALAYRWRQEPESSSSGATVGDMPAIARTCFEQSRDLMLICRITPEHTLGSFIDANVLASRCLGYSIDELRTLSPAELLPPDFPLHLPVSLDDQCPAAPLHYDTTLLTSDARRVPVDISLHFLPGQKRPSLLLAARSLTDRQRYEERLLDTRGATRQLQEELDVVTQQTPLAMIGLSPEGMVTRWNHAAELLFGWSAAAVIGQPLPTLLPDQRESFAVLRDRVLHGEIIQNETMSQQRQDGAGVTVSLSLAPIGTSDTVHEIIGFFVDMTERLRTDAELLRINRALKVLSEAKWAIARAIDVSTLLHAVCRILIEIGGYRFAWIGNLRQTDLSITPIAAVGEPTTDAAVVPPAWCDNRQVSNPSVIALRKAQPVIVNNLLLADQSPWVAKALEHGYGATIALPITGWQAYGVLTIFTGAYQAFDKEEVGLLSELADDIAYGIEMMSVQEEREQAEQALRASAQQWRTTFDAISAPVYVVDTEGVITRCNKALTTFLREPYNQIIGRNTRDLFQGTSEFLADCLRSLVEETGQSESGVIPIGDQFYKVHVNPIHREDGQFLGCIHVMNNVTDTIKHEGALQENNARLRSLLNDTITTMAKIVEMRDPYTAGHEQRVSHLACAIAREMRLPEESVEAIRVAGMLHDIGKLAVPSDILNKPGPLNNVEHLLIQMHAQVGYDTLRTIDFPWPVAKIVWQHHERYDGSGYPHRLAGAQILLEARILAVADVVESMASHRPYRPARGIAVSLQEIAEHRGSHYDPDVVDACRGLFLKKGYTLAEAHNLQGELG